LEGRSVPDLPINVRVRWFHRPRSRRDLLVTRRSGGAANKKGKNAEVDFADQNFGVWWEDKEEKRNIHSVHVCARKETTMLTPGVGSHLRQTLNESLDKTK